MHRNLPNVKNYISVQCTEVGIEGLDKLRVLRASRWSFSLGLSENVYKRIYPKRGNEGTKSGQKYNCSLSLTSVLDGCGWSTTIAAALPPRMRSGTHCTGGWEGPRIAWRGAENLAPTSIWFPERPAHIVSLYWLSYPDQQENMYRICYFLRRKFVSSKLEKTHSFHYLKFFPDIFSHKSENLSSVSLTFYSLGF
jgi:hypothetical protein